MTALNGMHAATGAPLGGAEHLRQSIADILLTPKGTRIMRPEYGSDLPELLDGPMDRGLPGRLRSATAEALDRWEPRLRVTRVNLRDVQPGRAVFDLDAVDPDTGDAVRVEAILVDPGGGA